MILIKKSQEGPDMLFIYPKNLIILFLQLIGKLAVFNVIKLLMANLTLDNSGRTAVESVN